MMSATSPSSQNTDSAAGTSQEGAPTVSAGAHGVAGKRWYVVHAYSGMEKSVARALQERIDRGGLQAFFGRILVPTEEVVEIKGGKRAITERRLYSGYVLVEMEMADEAWHLVKTTPKVTGFLGGTANRPSPLSQREVDEILQRMQEGYEKPRPKVLFEVGEMVRIKEPPFTDFNGNVEEVNYEKNRLRVSVTIFGRSTPVELEFSQVEKV
jgi:transcription termination/antitermination protein NusG